MRMTKLIEKPDVVDPVRHFARHGAFVKLIALFICRLPAIIFALGFAGAGTVLLHWMK